LSNNHQTPERAVFLNKQSQVLSGTSYAPALTSYPIIIYLAHVIKIKILKLQ